LAKQWYFCIKIFPKKKLNIIAFNIKNHAISKNTPLRQMISNPKEKTRAQDIPKTKILYLSKLVLDDTAFCCFKIQRKNRFQILRSTIIK